MYPHGTYPDHHRQSGAEQKVHHRAGKGHGVGSLRFPLHVIPADFVKTAAFPVCFGKRLDDPGAGHVFLHLAYQTVQTLLGSLVQAYTVAGGVHHGDAQQRQGGNEHQGKHRLQRQRHQDAAQQQHGRTYAQALHAVNHLVNIIDVAVDAGHQGWHGEMIHLGTGKMHGLVVQVRAQAAGNIPGSGAGHIVGDGITSQCQQRAKHHEPAPQPRALKITHGGTVIQYGGEQPGQVKLYHCAADFDHHGQADPGELGADILINCAHQSCPLSVAHASARSATRLSSASKVSASWGERLAVR